MLKKLLLTVAIVGVAAFTHAQGTVTFNTRVVGARVFDVDGVTPVGAGFVAQLFAADGAGAADTSLTAKGTPVGFGTTSSSAGYVLTSPPVNTSVGVSAAAGTVTIQMRAWDSAFADYATAKSSGGKFGQSNLITVSATVAPATPPNLVGLQGFTMVPEPTTIALGVMGVGALLFRRRK